MCGHAIQPDTPRCPRPDHAPLRGPSAAAQTPQGATVTGTITNSLSGDAAPNVVVVIDSPKFSQTVKTGADGKFTLVNVPPGVYHLSVRGDGYLSSRSDITVSGPSQTSDLRIDPELHYSEVTSVSPDARNQFDAYQATNVLGGQELTQRAAGDAWRDAAE